MYAVNSSVPGPTLRVTEGDWVTVAVVNTLASEPTTLHWHGMLQVQTGYSDGVSGLTQCALPGQGGVLTYAFRAAPSGTFWWHGHMGEQYLDGLYGALIVDPLLPPSPLPYSSELTILLADFYNARASTLLTSYYLTPASGGAEPIPSAIALNGQLSPYTLDAAGQPTLATGSNASSSPGLLLPLPSRTATTRLRFIAANALSMFSIAIDGVSLQVVELDGTPVAPYEVAALTLNVAQRASVLVDWSTLPPSTRGGAVFLRVTPLTSMYTGWSPGYLPPYESTLLGASPLVPLHLAAFAFGGSTAWPLYPPGTPLPPAAPAAHAADPSSSDCNYLEARPVRPVPMPPPTHTLYAEIAFTPDSRGVSRGRFNGIAKAHRMGAATPVLHGLMRPDLFPAAAAAAAAAVPLLGAAGLRSAVPGVEGAALLGAASSALPAIRYTPGAQYLLPYNATVLVLLNNTDDGEHPMHIHGHQFWVLATSANPAPAAVAAGGAALSRDVVSVPARGWAIIVMQADNVSVQCGSVAVSVCLDLSPLSRFSPSTTPSLPLPAWHMDHALPH